MSEVDDRSWIAGWPPNDPVAIEVLSIVERGLRAADHWSAAIGARHAAARRGTVVHGPDDPLPVPPLRAERTGEGRRCRVAVTDESTQEAALRRRAERADVVVLNFASAMNPGGGFLLGARAQEEDLCRCSTLFEVLAEQRGFYEHRRASGDPLHSDAMIRSPGVPFFRPSATGGMLEEALPVSVITAAAPNLRRLEHGERPSAAALHELFVRRWSRDLELAAAYGDRVVVLGAWGCGAFRNDPELVAGAAHEALVGSAATEALDEVAFAIPDRGPIGRANHAAFRRILGSSDPAGD